MSIAFGLRGGAASEQNIESLLSHTLRNVQTGEVAKNQAPTKSWFREPSERGWVPKLYGRAPGPETVQSGYPGKTLKPSSPALVRFEVNQVEQFPVRVLCKLLFMIIGFFRNRVWPEQSCASSRDKSSGTAWGSLG